MEDENGEPISEEIKARVRGDVQSYWNDVHASGETLKKWSETGLQRKDDFRRTFETKYPWLRLCEAGWKVDCLWMSQFKNKLWQKNATPEPKNVTPEPKTTVNTLPANADRINKIPQADIIITSSSSDTDSSGASTKRQRDPREALEEEEAAKRPRNKGKEVDLMAPTKFHHSRPQPRKKMYKAPKLKMAKVRLISYLLEIVY